MVTVHKWEKSFIRCMDEDAWKGEGMTGQRLRSGHEGIIEYFLFKPY